MKLDAETRGDAIAAASCAGTGALLTLRTDGKELGAAAKADLLARAVARESVSLEIELLAFEQVAGARNRNAVRFRDGAMAALGRTGRGTPFLRDHDQRNVLARGGTVIDSSTTKIDDGHYQLRQVVELTEPGAVERALRGLMSTVSIGWRPTGPVLCSACGTEVLDRCWHFPGDEIKLDGGESAAVVEWVFTAAELVETSEVSVPAVPTAGIERIKAALAARGITGDRAVAAHERQTPQENSIMDKLKSALVGLLALAATASDDEVVNAVTTLKRDREALSASNAELTKLQARLAAEAAAAASASEARELADFLAAGVNAGKFSPGSALEKSLGDFFAADKEGARKLADSLPRLTPVGEVPQRGVKPPAVEPGKSALAGAADRIASHSPYASIDGVRRSLAAMGKSPAEVDRIIASQLAPKEA